MAVRQRTRLKRAPKTVIPDFPGHMADTTPTQPSFETHRSGLPCRRSRQISSKQNSRSQTKATVFYRCAFAISVEA